VTTEVLRPGALPLWEVPGWRERFGVTAGITGRGDDPTTPFDLGLWTDRPVGTVMAQWRAFRQALAPDSAAMVMAHQVHGERVLWHADAAPGGWTIHEGADGHATDVPGLALLVTVADCVPVYLVAPRRRAIALLHAGWRGTAAGILARGLALLGDRAGVTPDEVVMHAGVAISGPCYEVGAEVMAGVGALHHGAGPWHLDLREVLAEQGRALGVHEVTVSSHCSARGATAFHSHRRSGGRDGRMVAWLGLIPPTADNPD
jgi:polyphenol oxidase